MNASLWLGLKEVHYLILCCEKRTKYGLLIYFNKIEDTATATDSQEKRLSRLYKESLKAADSRFLGVTEHSGAGEKKQTHQM